MKPKRKLLAAVAIAASVAVLASCGSSGSSGSSASPGASDTNTKNAITIGVLEDNAGPGAPYSDITVGAIKATIDQINDDGGVIDRPLKVITANDSSDPTKSAAAVRKLLDQGASAILATTGSPSIIQVKPIIQKAQVPMIAPTTLSADVAAQPDGDFSYSIANSVDDMTQAYVNAFNDAGYKNVAILADTSPVITDYNKAFSAAFDKAGLQVVTDQTASPDATDVTAQVVRVKQAKPDAVLIASVGGQIEAQFQNATASQMPDTPRFSLAALGNQPDAWKLLNPGVGDNLVYVSSLDDTNPVTKTMTDIIRKAKGSSYQIVAYDAQAYDAVHLLTDAIDRAGAVDGPKINDALQETTDFKSSFGQKGFTLSFGPDKHIANDGLCGMALRTMKDNKPGPLWSTFQPAC